MYAPNMSRIHFVGFRTLLIFSAFFLVAPECCRVKRYVLPVNDKTLKGHVFKTLQVKQEAMCRANCFLEDDCQSFNIDSSPQDGTWECELSSTDDKQNPASLVASEGKIYHATENPCSSSPCSQNATCQPSFLEDDSFSCICPIGFQGEFCNTDVDECTNGTHNCSLAGAACINSVGSFNCTCNIGFVGDGYNCFARKGFAAENPAKTCAEVLNNTLNAPDGGYFLQSDDGEVMQTYCHMTNITGCGAGPWTLVMKINGHLMTFHYNSHYWSDKLSFNVNGGATGFDLQETKLPTYWNTPINKLCVGIMVGNNTRWTAVNHKAASLHAVLADGVYRPTNLGRSTWKSLIDGSSLQHHCDIEGFNVYLPSFFGAIPTAARIGIVADDIPMVCLAESESRLGFGTMGNSQLTHDWNTCGNEASWWFPDNGERHTNAHCYILAQ